MILMMLLCLKLFLQEEKFKWIVGRCIPPQKIRKGDKLDKKEIWYFKRLSLLGYTFWLVLGIKYGFIAHQYKTCKLSVAILEISSNTSAFLYALFDSRNYFFNGTEKNTTFKNQVWSIIFYYSSTCLILHILWKFYE